MILTKITGDLFSLSKVNLAAVRMGKQKKKVDQYIIHMNKLLGEGQFGKVYEGIDTTSSQMRAIKVIAKKKIIGNQYMERAIKQQYSIMRKVNSLWTVRCYEMIETDNNFYIISELCNNGNFRGRLNKFPRGFGSQQAYAWVIKLLKCFMVLAEKGIIHRDLKPENILLQDEDLKLCDFGFAKISEHSNVFKTSTGTPVYMSPQILRQQTYTEKSDIWSLGIVSYEILYGKRPVPGVLSLGVLKDWYYQNNIQYPPLQGENTELHTQIIDFLKGCLQVQQTNRFGWSEVYGHKIFKEYFQYNQKMKVGFILTRLRISIHCENIDVESLIKQNCGQAMNFQQFNIFMQVLLADTAPEESKYLMQIYGFIDMQTQQQMIQVSNLVEVFKKASITLKSMDFQQVYASNSIIQSKRLQEQHQLVLTVFKDVWNFVEPPQPNPEAKIKPTIKCCASIRKLRDTIINSNVDLNQFFEYQIQMFRKTDTNQLDWSGFHKLLLKINPYFEEYQTKRVFKIFDIQGKEKIALDDIYKTMCVVSGKPSRSRLLSKLNINK